MNMALLSKLLTMNKIALFSTLALITLLIGTLKSQDRRLEILDATSENSQVFGDGKVVDLILDAVEKESVALYYIDYSTGSVAESNVKNLKRVFEENLEIKPWVKRNYKEGDFVRYNDQIYVCSDDSESDDIPDDSWKWDEIDEDFFNRSNVKRFTLDVYEKGSKRYVSYVNFYIRFWGYFHDFYAFSLKFSDFRNIIDRGGLVSLSEDDIFNPFWKGNMILSEWNPLYEFGEPIESGKTCFPLRMYNC